MNIKNSHVSIKHTCHQTNKQKKTPKLFSAGFLIGIKELENKEKVREKKCENIMMLYKMGWKTKKNREFSNCCEVPGLCSLLYNLHLGSFHEAILMGPAYRQ